MLSEVSRRATSAGQSVRLAASRPWGRAEHVPDPPLLAYIVLNLSSLHRFGGNS
jgi:hypothetical protein